MVEIEKIELSQPPAEQTATKVVSGNKKRKLPKWFKTVLIIFFVLLVLLLVQAVVVVPGLIKTGKELSHVGQTITVGLQAQDLIPVNEGLAVAEEDLLKLQKQYRLLITYRFVPGLRAYYQDGEAGLAAALAGVRAGQILVQAIEPYADILGFRGHGSFAGGTTEDRLMKVVETIEKVTPEIDLVVEQLEVAEENLARINPERYPESFKDQVVRAKLIKIQQAVGGGVTTLKELRPGLEVLPALLGHPESKKYLLMFQNDTEKRPTGGFMTAYATLNVESGKVRAEGSQDIYTLDAKFKQRLEPPEPIKKYHKNVAYFYLRDMNLSPDFKTSMDLFRTYYDEIPGESEVNGVVAVDTQVLTRLIEVLGPVEVPGYGKFTAEIDERCNCPNIIYQLELIADEPTHFFKEDRKGVLGPLMQEIMFKALGAENHVFPQLFATLWQSLKERHMLFYFDNPEEQAAAEAMGFAGRIQPAKGDYLMLVDTNFGGAKSDLYIEQTIDQQISVADDGSVEKTVTIEYKNPEEPDNCSLERASGLCLNGLYRDWVRLYVPQGSELIEILGSEVEPVVSEEGDKTVFEAFYGDESPLRPLGKAKLVFRYKLPFKAIDDYNLYLQKQAGTKDFNYSFTLNDQPQPGIVLNQDQRLNFKL